MLKKEHHPFNNHCIKFAKNGAPFKRLTNKTKHQTNKQPNNKQAFKLDYSKCSKTTNLLNRVFNTEATSTQNNFRLYNITPGVHSHISVQSIQSIVHPPQSTLNEYLKGQIDEKFLMDEYMIRLGYARYVFSISKYFI